MEINTFFSIPSFLADHVKNAVRVTRLILNIINANISLGFVLHDKSELKLCVYNKYNNRKICQSLLIMANMAEHMLTTNYLLPTILLYLCLELLLMRGKFCSSEL